MGLFTDHEIEMSMYSGRSRNKNTFIGRPQDQLHWYSDGPAILRWSFHIEPTIHVYGLNMMACRFRWSCSFSAGVMQVVIVKQMFECHIEENVVIQCCWYGLFIYHDDTLRPSGAQLDIQCFLQCMYTENYVTINRTYCLRIISIFILFSLCTTSSICMHVLTILAWMCFIIIWACVNQIRFDSFFQTTTTQLFQRIDQ